jgi:hypothetical protein
MIQLFDHPLIATYFFLLLLLHVLAAVFGGALSVIGDRVNIGVRMGLSILSKIPYAVNIALHIVFIVFLFMNAFTIEEGTLLYMISAFTFAAVNWLRYVVFDRKKQLKAEEQKATSVEPEENEGGIAEEGVR